MGKFLVLGLIGILIGVFGACGGNGNSGSGDGGGSTGGSAGQVAATVAPTTAPVAPTTREDTKPVVSQATASLQDVAAKLAGGPGAIYIGDLSQLVGPALDPEIADAEGNVPLSALEKWDWIFTSDYYAELIEKANLENPTEVVTQGEETEIQMVCIVRFTPRCKVIEYFFAPNILERTNGQLTIELVSYPELGIAGPDVMALVDDGTLTLAEIATPYVAGELPALEVNWLWGLYPTARSQFEVSVAVIPELNRLVTEQTGGGMPIAQFWAVPDETLFFFTKKPLRTLEDFQGLKLRSFGGAVSDLIAGMGAEGQFVAFAEVYVAMERGILDGGLTSTTGARGGRWYEVIDYMTGSFPIFTPLFMYMNADAWNNLPADFQQILLEEGAKFELELFRHAPVLGETGVPKAIETGLEYSEFSPEVKDYIFNEVVLNRIIPNWVKRTGGPESEGVKLFNELVGPIVGVQINPDGTASVTGQAATATASTAGVPANLAAYAAEHAGGPGAIYVGDLSQLVGPAPTPDQGDFDGVVSLEAVEIDSYIYESPYYQSLIDKAKFTNPTELVTSGEKFTIQHTCCINRALLPCKVIDSFLRGVVKAI